MSESFIKASRLKLRFSGTRGSLSVEDLWDLDLQDLNRIAVAVDSAIAPTTRSFLKNADTKADAAAKINELRLDVLKTVIQTKEADIEAAAELAQKNRTRAFYKSLLEKRQLEQMESLSAEEIQKQLDMLDGKVPAEAAPAPAAQ